MQCGRTLNQLHMRSSPCCCHRLFIHCYKTSTSTSPLAGHCTHFLLPFSPLCRQYRSQHQLNCGPLKNFLDGELIWQYTHLSASEKTQLANQIGTEVEQVGGFTPLAPMAHAHTCIHTLTHRDYNKCVDSESPYLCRFRWTSLTL